VAGATEELYQEVKHLLTQTKVVVVDLAELTYVDSSGLGALVRLHVSARQLGCEFKLRHLGRQLRNVLKANEPSFGSPLLFPHERQIDSFAEIPDGGHCERRERTSV